MNQDKKTIESLFSDSGPFDEAVVVEALGPHITIQRSSNRIFFKDSKLSTSKKILAYALAKKLLASKSLIESEMLTAQEFYEATKINKNTIDPTFKTLREKGFLVGKSEYEIPITKISSVIEILGK